MIRKDDSRRKSVLDGDSFAKSKFQPSGKGPNHPVAVDQFDEEHMGIAAKE